MTPELPHAFAPNQVAVVTGAASGIGLAAARRFASLGMKVVLADLGGAALDRAAASLGSAQALAVPTDVSKESDLTALRTKVSAHFGPVSVLMNNAGVGQNPGKPWENGAGWQTLLDVNLWGVIHGVRAFVPRILASKEEGHVVNIGSMASVLALARLGPYTVAKHGVLGLSDVLRAELASLQAPVGVSVVMPGMIKTGMNPVGIVSSATVAANVVDAIRHGRPYVFTDDHSSDQVDERLRAMLSARADVIS